MTPEEAENFKKGDVYYRVDPYDHGIDRFRDGGFLKTLLRDNPSELECRFLKLEEAEEYANLIKIQRRLQR